MALVSARRWDLHGGLSFPLSAGAVLCVQTVTWGGGPPSTALLSL